MEKHFEEEEGWAENQASQSRQANANAVQFALSYPHHSCNDKTKCENESSHARVVCSSFRASLSVMSEIQCD